MNIAEAVGFSLQALRSNRLRTFLTALGLIIGNASVILVVTISLASKDLILDLIRGVGSNLVYAFLEQGGQNDAQVQSDFVKIADVRAIREAFGDRLLAATAVLPSNDQLVLNGKIRPVTVDGVDEYYRKVRNLQILTGRSFDATDMQFRQRVAMVSDKLAVRAYGSTEAAIGQPIRVYKLQFTVIGTFRERTSTFGQSEISDDTILIPYTLMRGFLPVERVEPVYMQVRDASDVVAVSEEVGQLLRQRHRPGAHYNVQNLKSILDTADSVANVMTIVLVIVSGIALVISGIGIMNIMLVTVTERTREIGLRMAVGAARREVLLQFLVEAVLISLIGGAIGIVIGLSVPLTLRLPFFTRLIENAGINLVIPISPASVLVAFAVSFTVGVCFGLLPARRASQLNPTEALRYE